MTKKPPNPKDALGAKVDELLGPKARGDILKDSWSAQGVERRLKSLELMIAGWRAPNTEFYKTEREDIAPEEVRIVTGVRTKNPLQQATEADIENLETGINRCRKLLDDSRVLLEPKDPPPGWLQANAAEHGKKVREKLAEIDEVIQGLNNIEDRITNQRLQQAARKAVRAGGKTSATGKRKKT